MTTDKSNAIKIAVIIEIIIIILLSMVFYYNIFISKDNNQHKHNKFLSKYCIIDQSMYALFLGLYLNVKPIYKLGII
jgi:uncharacterized PurR-regulated membrane protein YhhQ (DUF165 family)